MVEFTRRDPYKELHSVSVDQLRHETKETLVAFASLTDSQAGQSDTVTAFVKASFTDLGIVDTNDHNWVAHGADSIWSADASDRPPRNEALVEIFRNFITLRPEMDSDYKAQMWRIVWHATLIQFDNNRYPRFYNKSLDWQTAFRSILETRKGRESIEDNLVVKHNQANEPRRYGPYKVALAMHRNVFPKTGVSIVDDGTSAGFTSKNEQVNAFLRSKLMSRLAVSKCVGSDINPILDRDSIAWADACYYRAEDLQNQKIRRRRREMYTLRQELLQSGKLAIVHGDLIPYEGPLYSGMASTDNLEEVKALAPNPDGTYDSSVSILTYYEMAEEDRQAAMETQVKQAKFLAYVAGWINKSADLSKLEHAPPYQAPMEAYISYPDDPKRRWRHWGTYGNGRGTSFHPSPALESLVLDRIKHPMGRSRLEETD
jgi:hypothetical protein